VSKISIVIPTLGMREKTLYESVASCLAISNCIVTVVGPLERIQEILSPLQSDRLSILPDPGGGPVSAINFGLLGLAENCEYFNWLGDDDLLHPDGVTESLNYLDENPHIGLLLGAVSFIDTNGVELFRHDQPIFPKVNASFGPQKIAQPGLIFRSSILKDLGYLNGFFECAWDQEYITRVLQVENYVVTKRVLASYRHHSGSITQSLVSRSLIESAYIRIQRRGPIGFIFQAGIELVRFFGVNIFGTRLTTSKSLLETLGDLRKETKLIVRKSRET